MAFNLDSFLRFLTEGGYHSFSYDTNRESFQVGTEFIPVSPSWVSDATDVIKAQPTMTAEEVSTCPLVIEGNYSTTLFALPLLRPMIHAIGESQKSSLVDETKLVMRSASVAFERASFGDVSDLSSNEAIPFQVVLDDPTVQMPVFGVPPDAALHPMADGIIGERGWASGVVEYGTNNVDDMPSWEAALYAGFGHLARRATNLLRPEEQH